MLIVTYAVLSDRPSVGEPSQETKQVTHSRLIGTFIVSSRYSRLYFPLYGTVVTPSEELDRSLTFREAVESPD